MDGLATQPIQCKVSIFACLSYSLLLCLAILAVNLASLSTLSAVMLSIAIALYGMLGIDKIKRQGGCAVVYRDEQWWLLMEHSLALGVFSGGSSRGRPGQWQQITGVKYQGALFTILALSAPNRVDRQLTIWRDSCSIKDYYRLTALARYWF